MEKLKECKYGVFWIPEGGISRIIRRSKEDLRRIDPDAAYLNHPIHCTLFVFRAFKENEAQIVNTLYTVCSEMNSFEVVCNVWHIFHNDFITGGDTLAIRIQDSVQLKELQMKIALSMQDYRSSVVPYNIDWQGDFFNSMSKFGFPFVGSHWIPHLTIGSTRVQQFLTEQIKAPIQLDQKSLISHLSLFQITDDIHEPICEFNFKL